MKSTLLLYCADTTSCSQDDMTTVGESGDVSSILFCVSSYNRLSENSPRNLFCVFTGSSFLYWQITRICFSLWECPDVFLYYRLFSLTFMYIISIASAQQWRVVKISATVTLLSQLSQEHESVMASEWGLVGSPRLLQTRFYNLCSVHVW